MDEELIIVEFKDMVAVYKSLCSVVDKLSEAKVFAEQMADAFLENDSVYFGEARNLLEFYNQNIIYKISLLETLVTTAFSYVDLCIAASQTESAEMINFMNRLSNEDKSKIWG